MVDVVFTSPGKGGVVLCYLPVERLVFFGGTWKLFHIPSLCIAI